MKFYDCSSQFLKSVTTTATSIFDVQATGGDNDEEEEDEAKWDNDFEKKFFKKTCQIILRLIDFVSNREIFCM